MVHLGGVTIGRKFYLFYDAADMDLQKFLTGHYKLFEHESFRSQCLDVITQACGLASGLKHLHKFSLDNRKVACYHRDLKPDNILIRDWHPTYSPVGTWMISDFGLSTIRKVGENTEVGDDEEDTEVGKGLPLSVAAVVHRQSRAVTAKRECSTFGPPESKVSRRSDVWSFGCILTVVLTYILGGIDLVEEFDCWRSIGDDGRECDGYFYRRKSDNTYVRSPQVDDWLVRLGTGDSQDTPWVSRCTDLISKTLEIEVTKRPATKEVYKELIRVIGIVKDVRKASYNTSPLPTTPLGISIPVFEVTDLESKPSPDSPTQTIVPMDQDSLEAREESDNSSSESSITSKFIHRSSAPANSLGPIVATWNPTSMTSDIPRTIPSFPVLDPSYVYSSAEAVDLAELARSDGTGLSQQLASETFEKNSGRGPLRASAFSTVGPLPSQRTPDPRRTVTASPRKAFRFLPARKRPDPPAPLASLPQSGEVASSTTNAIPSRYLTFSTGHEHIITTAFCSSGKLVVYVSEKTVWVYSTSLPEEQWTLKKDLKHPYDSCHLKLTAPPNVVWKAAVLAPRYICLQAAVKSSTNSGTFVCASQSSLRI